MDFEKEKRHLEYEKLQTEALFYMQSYQNVRNMMYVVSVAILGFGLNMERPNCFIFLLPQFVIVPSFLVSVDYWRSITKISSYLRKFHDDNNSLYIWSTGIKKLDNLIKLKNKGKRAMDFQHISYVSAFIVSMMLYFLYIEYNGTTVFYIKLVIGIVVTIVSIVVFIKFWKFDPYYFDNGWIAVKESLKHSIIE